MYKMKNNILIFKCRIPFLACGVNFSVQKARIHGVLPTETQIQMTHKWI